MQIILFITLFCCSTYAQWLQWPALTVEAIGFACFLPALATLLSFSVNSQEKQHAYRHYRNAAALSCAYSHFAIAAVLTLKTPASDPFTLLVLSSLAMAIGLIGGTASARIIFKKQASQQNQTTAFFTPCILKMHAKIKGLKQLNGAVN